MDQQLCALCLRNRNLRRSHIFPEFFYRSIYDGKGRFFQISTDPLAKVVIHQKGLRGRLLCSGCEVYLSGIEDYAKRVLYDSKDIQVRRTHYGVEALGLDYTKFKLFQLSLIWRAGVCRLPEFGQVRLGPHQENLRLRLFTKEPGRQEEYPCLLVYSQTAASIVPDLISLPFESSFDGHRSYVFLLGGVFWIFFVSSHIEASSGATFALSDEGNLPIIIDSGKSTPYLRRLAQNLVTNARKVRRFIT